MEYAKTSRGVVLQHEGREEYYIKGSAEMRYRVPCCAALRWKMRTESDPVAMVQFKNKRVDYYLNTQMLHLEVGDLVTVSTSPGHDVGAVTLTGWAAHREYLKRRPADAPPPLEIFRLSTRNDIDRWIESVSKEREALSSTREEAQKLGLEMKIFDVEYQGDGNKLTVYYSSDQRVDFRTLVKQLADRFGVRIQMQQQGVRQEPARIGGLGPCGQEVCCSRFMRCTPPVLSASMKMQDLQVIACTGQCGKLKCCLNFELDSYVEARSKMPKVREPLRFDGYDLYYVKSDIFRKLMWFSTAPKSTMNLVMLTVDEVLDVMAQNARGEVAEPVEKMREQESTQSQNYARIENVIEADNISRFDQLPSKGKKKKRRRKSRSEAESEVNSPNASATPSGQTRANSSKRQARPRTNPQAKPSPQASADSSNSATKDAAPIHTAKARRASPRPSPTGRRAANPSSKEAANSGNKTAASPANAPARPNETNAAPSDFPQRRQRPRNTASEPKNAHKSSSTGKPPQTL